MGASGCASTPQGCARWKQAGRLWRDAKRSNSGVKPSYSVAPEGLADLVEIVECAERERMGVRMTGAGFSFSDVAFSRGFLLSPAEMGAALELPKDQLRAGVDARLHFRAEAGARISSLNAELDCAGLAFSNLGGTSGQTIVGAAMTATHGSGLRHGPISSQIASMQVVTAGASVLQLEPTAGITDPQKFPGYIESQGRRVPAKLVQDDAHFNAVVVSMGAMGLVYAVVLKVVPAYWLQEVPHVVKWGELTCPGGFMDRLMRGQPLSAHGPEPYSYEVLLNPYPASIGGGPADHQCVLQQYYKLEQEPWRSASDRKRGMLGKEVDALATELSAKGALLAETVNHRPDLAPAALNASLASRGDRTYINKSHEIFNIGPVNYMRAFGIEMSFRFEDAVRVAERFFELARSHYDQGMVHTTPCTLRFVKPSAANLAMMHDRKTVTLEIGSAIGVRRSREMLVNYEKVFISEFAARPHWGADLNVLTSIDQVRALWGEANVDQWLAIYRQLNRTGTFNSPFTDRLGISVQPA